MSAALGLALALPVAALSSLEIDLGELLGPGWQARAAHASIGLGAGGAMRLELRIEGGAFSDARGLRAGEGLALGVAARLAADGRVRAGARLDAGQMYLDPVFLDATARPLSLDLEGRWDGAERLEVARLGLEEQGGARLEGTARLSRAGLERARLSLGGGALAPLFARYVQPFLAGTALAAARATGQVGARVAVDGGALSGWDLELEDVTIDDQTGRLALEGMAGELHWRRSGAPPPIRLRLRAARLYRLSIGATELRGEYAGERFRLTAPLLVPVLDGVLRVAALAGDGLGGEAPRWRLRGALSPVSLARLSAALGWPALAGTVAGSIPGLEIASDEVRVEGDLRVEAFGGEVVLSHLRLESPFGVVPRLSADARLRDLSLDEITRTFSFGTILGRLEGRVDGLVLEGWRPSAFEAVLQTPRGDTSVHRISQRAVDNLARIGGASGALSSTFLRLFETFSYRRLGLRCRLAGGVCEMDGVAPAGGGYYIVEGGGLPPRIDVIGHNRKVDWQTLVARLRAIGAGGPPVVR